MQHACTHSFIHMQEQSDEQTSKITIKIIITINSEVTSLKLHYVRSGGGGDVMAE